MCSLCNDPHHEHPEYLNSSLSRRELFKSGTAAIVGGVAAAAFSQTPASAQAPAGAPTPGAPPGLPPGGAMGPAGRQVIFWGQGGTPELAVQVEAERQTTSRTAGTRFRAHIRYNGKLSYETLTLKPIHPLQVVIRNQAVQTCYTGNWQLNFERSQNGGEAIQTGHGGVGEVIDVGTAVKRVKVGDQVLISATPQCGVCGNCLVGRGDSCLTRLPSIASATMSDNTPVYMTSRPMGPGGNAELVVSEEDWLAPIFTRVSPQELSILGCPTAVGLGLAVCRFPVEAGSDVAVFGLGAMGSGAVQGARIQGARTIIGIDPIRYRRDLALKLGATHVLDPNEHRGNALAARIRELTPSPVPAGRRYANERPGGVLYALEGTARAAYPLAPGIEAPPEENLLQQIYTSVRNGGFMKLGGTPTGSLTGVNVGNKVVTGGNFSGMNMLTDLPRFIHMIERGLFDAKSMIGRTYRFEQSQEAMIAASDRSVITTVIDFT
jgi:S-(hydroxymethyl)glutathione dehydrogenase/alcohol dehydrogenase